MSKNKKKASKKDVWIRALKTFWQAALAYFILNITTITDAILTDIECGGFESIKEVGLTLAMGALASALSAVYNGVISPLFNTEIEDDYDCYSDNDENEDMDGR